MAGLSIMRTTLSFLHPALMKYREKQNLNITSQKLSFFAKSQLVVTKQKTEYIVFSTRKRLTHTFLKVDNEKIAESKSMKYLGVIIDNKLKFDGEVKKRKAMRIKQHYKSKKITYDIRKNNNVLTVSFIAQAIPIYNSLLILD